MVRKADPHGASSHRDDEGRLVDDDPRRFGFHNLRHSMASFLVRIRTDPKTVQTLLRHSDDSKKSLKSSKASKAVSRYKIGTS